MADHKTKKRELIEWTILISIISIIYLGGWHTTVIGKLQQAVLFTGIISPSIVDEELIASYQFDLRDENGNNVSLVEFQGEVIFMNFWATWCPPCIAEMPDINNLYNEISGVRFVMISLDQDQQKALDFIAKKRFDFPIYFLNSTLPGTYDVSSIPTTYVLSKDGKIKVKNSGMAKYNSEKFRAYLSELKQAI